MASIEGESAFHNDRGVDLVRQGRFKEAVREYDTAIGLNPNDSRLHHNKGLALVQLSSFEEALLEFQKALSLGPKVSDYHISKGITLDYLQRSEEALGEFNEAIRIEPENPAHHNKKGISFYHLRRFEEAIKEYNTALGLDPSHPHYHYNRGLALNDLNRLGEAIQEYDKAIRLDPKEQAYHKSKEISLRMIANQHPIASIETFEKSLEFMNKKIFEATGVVKALEVTGGPVTPFLTKGGYYTVHIETNVDSLTTPCPKCGYSSLVDFGEFVPDTCFCPRCSRFYVVVQTDEHGSKKQEGGSS